MKQKLSLKLMFFLIKRFALLFTIALFSCAKEGALTGGVADTIAPEIIFSEPAGDTTSIGDLNQFYFRFSERVDRKSFEANFYLQPFLKNRPRFDWSGWDEVTVVLDDTLQNEITYLVGVAKGFKDLHNVLSDSEYRFALSKSAYLDSLRFFGSIKSNSNSQQIRLALFDTHVSDQPKYVTDVDNKNNFLLANIKASNYTHFFFNDKNRNFKFDINNEEIAFPPKALELLQSSKKDYHLTFNIIDTISPVIQKIDTVEYGLLSLKFDEALDLTKTEIYFTDSLNKNIPIHVIGSSLDYFGFFNADSVALPLRLNYKKISDLIDNKDDSLRLDFSLKQLGSKDTTEFKFLNLSPKTDTELSNLIPVFSIKFSKPVLWKDTYRSDIQLRNKNNHNIPLVFNQQKRTEITFQPKESLAVSENYSLILQFKQTKSIYNESLKDTTYMNKYLGISRNKFGSISFDLKSNNYDSAVVKLIDLDAKKTIREQLIRTNRTSELSAIPVGRYLLEFYIDLNANKIYDKGFIKPFHYAEPYFFYGDTIPVRGGWENSREQIIFND